MGFSPSKMPLLLCSRHGYLLLCVGVDACGQKWCVVRLILGAPSSFSHPFKRACAGATVARTLSHSTQTTEHVSNTSRVASSLLGIMRHPHMTFCIPLIFLSHSPISLCHGSQSEWTHITLTPALDTSFAARSALQMGKPRGIKCARKMRTKRRIEKWNDLDWNKSHSLTHMKANPFGQSQF